MTVGVDDELRIREYPGDDSATPRAYGFKILDEDDLRVTRTNADGSETVLVRGTHYSVSGAGNPTGGNVTPLAPIATGTSWRIEGDMSLGQPTDYTAGDDFPAESHERGLDRSMIAHQEARRDLNDTAARALMFPRGEAAGDLPSASDRANGFLGFDPFGRPIRSTGTGADLGLRGDLGDEDPDLGASLVRYGPWRASDALASRPFSLKEYRAAAVSDHQALQNIIDAAAANDTAHVTILIDDAFVLPAPVNIDRLVDTKIARLTFQGHGRKARLHSSVVDGSIFTTTLPGGTPQCERIEIRELLISSINSNRAYLFENASFLRMLIQNVDFDQIGLVNDPTQYLQSWALRDIRARYWKGPFLRANGAYDFHAHFADMKGGEDDGADDGDCFHLGSADRPLFACSVENGVYEGIQGSVLVGEAIATLSARSNYVEFNGKPSFDLGNKGRVGARANQAVQIDGNNFIQADAFRLDPALYEVVCGQTIRLSSRGNYCNGKLFDTSLMVGGAPMLVSTGDVVADELWKGATDDFLDPARAPVGNIHITDFDYFGVGAEWSAHDQLLGGRIAKSGVTNGGLVVPIRTGVLGPVSPQVAPGFYGNIYWAKGSRVENVDAGGSGQAAFWHCTASGAPGTWIAVVLP